MALRSATLDVLSTLLGAFPGGEVTRAELVDMIDSGDLDKMPQWLTTNPEYRVSRGVYRLPVELLGDEDAPSADADEPAAAVMQNKLDAAEKHSFVPKKSKNYVAWGNATNLSKVLKSDKFLPVFVTGLSGNGKTFTIEQEVAKANRELFRVNITTATDEDDLLGGFRLIDGDTVWFDGPVVEAMRRGAVLLLDELDLGTEKIMCLQSVLEGKGVFLKKTNQWVTPAPGFTVIATGNTKGQGDDTDKFIGTNVMNEAFLERFPIWFDQSYPGAGIETKIVKLLASNIGAEADDNLIDSLIKFAQQTRKTFDEGACEDLITTRRLCLIIELMPVFGDVKKALEIACNRFCEESRRAFLDLFDSLYVPTEEKARLEAEEKKREEERSKNESKYTVNVAPF